MDWKSSKLLSSFAGIASLDPTSISEVIIINNPLLSICEEQFICDYLETGNPATIENNIPGCSSINDVWLSCEFGNKVFFPVFIDFNENGILDSGEPYFSNTPINIEPGNITAYGNSINGGFTYLENGTFTFTYDPLINPDWELTTDSTSFTLTVGNASNDTIYFGIKPTNVLSLMNSIIISPPTRCNEFITFDIVAKNEGSTITNGTLWFQIDNGINAVEYIDPPDTIVDPDRYGWHFTDLYPGANIHNKSNSKYQAILAKIYISTPG